jgi:predicted MPP superfamily phosphohydrolase
MNTAAGAEIAPAALLAHPGHVSESAAEDDLRHCGLTWGGHATTVDGSAGRARSRNHLISRALRRFDQPADGDG